MPSGKNVRPKKWSKIVDLYDHDGYSAIWGIYENRPYKSLGVRWNENYPTQGKYPVWYVEPDFLAKTILEELKRKVEEDINRGKFENIKAALKELEYPKSKNKSGDPDEDLDELDEGGIEWGG